LIKLLLSLPDININFVRSDGLSPVDAKATGVNTTAYKFLVEKGAD